MHDLEHACRRLGAHQNPVPNVLQVTTLQKGPRPNYNSIIQFIVPMDAAFLRYFTATPLRLEVNQVTGGFAWAEVGRALLDLKTVSDDLRGETLGGRPRRRSLQVHGCAGAQLGSVTVRAFLLSITCCVTVSLPA